MRQKIYVKNNKLYEIRQERELTQKEFAEDILDANYSWYNQVENRERSISKKKANQICSTLNLDFDEVFEYREDREDIKDRDTTLNGEILRGWESIVERGINSLKESNSFWWGAGVLGSWINREKKGKEFGEALKNVLEATGKDDNKKRVRILINNTAETILATDSGKDPFELKDDFYEDHKHELVSKKVREVLENYKDRTKNNKMKNRIRWFPHGDIRVFIWDLNNEEEIIEEVMIVTAGSTSLGGGNQPRNYTGLVTDNSIIVSEFKNRFENLWEHGATPNVDPPKEDAEE